MIILIIICAVILFFYYLGFTFRILKYFLKELFKNGGNVMKPEELISSAKVELEEEEQKITEKVIESIYEKMKSNIKNGRKFDPVDISQEIRSNYNNRSSSKIFKNAVNRFEEDGYYIWNGYVFISRHSCKVWHLKLMLPVLILVVIYIISKLIHYFNLM